MTAHTQFPWIVSSTLGGRHTREVLAEHYDQMCNEIDAARRVLDQANSYAHACGLFSGGFEMPTFVALAELLRELPETPPVVGLVTEGGIVPMLVDGEETP